MLASGCAWVFSCDFDLHSEGLRVARHTVDPVFWHCRWIAEITQLDIIQFNSIYSSNLDCPRKFRLRPLWWFRKSFGFYSCRPRHCPVDASFHFSFVCSTGGIQARTFIRRTHRNEVEQDTLISTDTTDKSESINTVYGRQCRTGAYHAMSGFK